MTEGDGPPWATRRGYPAAKASTWPRHDSVHAHFEEVIQLQFRTSFVSKSSSSLVLKLQNIVCNCIQSTADETRDTQLTRPSQFTTSNLKFVARTLLGIVTTNDNSENESVLKITKTSCHLLKKVLFLFIIMGSPDLKRPNLTAISEKQGTCSRT